MLRQTGLLFIFAGLALGETQSGSVTSGGQAIPGATIVALCGTDKITTVTDDAGRFEIGGLPSTPCQFSVAMFGFEAAPKEATASSTTLNFDLRLQTRATLPAEPNSPNSPATEQAGGRGGFRRRQNGADNGNNPPQAGNGPGRGGLGGPGRGGFGRGAQAANGQTPGQQAAPQGFQNLNLQQNGENNVAESELAPGAEPADATGAN